MHRNTHPLILAAAFCFAAAAGQDASNTPATWSPELTAALELYRVGEYLEVQQICRQIISETTYQTVSNDAAAVEALAIARMPGRDNRNDARARLTRLAKDDPALFDRPECRLAYGIASYELHETATALLHLTKAVDAFTDRRQPARAGEASVWLAKTWLRHAEWEVPVPGVVVRRPENRADADRIRRERVDALRAGVAALPGGQTYAARIDLAIAERLLTTPGRADEGAELLRTLTERRSASPVRAEAALALGKLYEQEGRWIDAADLYERVQADHATAAREARRRRDAIVGPRLELGAPARVAPGQHVPIELTCRNVEAVNVEVRRIDLRAWLEKQQGRLAEAALPGDGALVALHDFQTVADDRHAWWNASEQPNPPTFEASSGAAVVVARAKTFGGDELVSKRLIVSGDLRAHMFLGRARATLWVTSSGDADLGQARAWFWMRGSFVPKRPPITDGVAGFTLPAESRLLRDKRWVCLVQAGEHMALCEGVLPDQEGGRRSAAALIAAPPTPRVGETLHIFGFLPGVGMRAAGSSKSRQVEVVLTDAADAVHVSTTVPVDQAGAFVCEFPVTSAMAGEHLRPTVRLDGNVLKQISESLEIVPQWRETPSLDARCTTAPWIAADAPSLNARVELAGPRPGSRDGLEGSAWIQAASLPESGSRQPPVFSQVVHLPLSLGAGGTVELTQSIDELGLPDRPLAVGVWTRFEGSDARASSDFTQLLVGPAPIHIWVRAADDGRRVGERLRFEVGCFDPGELATGQTPRVAVRHASEQIAELDATPIAERLYQAYWRPPTAGQYEIVATLQTRTGEVFRANESFAIVADGADPDRQPPPLRYAAQYETVDGQPHVRVRLAGERREPILAIVAAAEPLAAKPVPASGDVRFSLPLSEDDRDARLVLVSETRQGLQIIGETKIEPEQDAAELAISIAGAAPAPGQTIAVTVADEALGKIEPGATILLRLAPLDAAVGGPWSLADRPADPPDSSGVICVSSAADMEANADATPRLPGPWRLSPRRARAYFDLPTLWLASKREPASALTFETPLPAKPGRYRLIAAAHLANGGLASGVLDLDTRQKLTLALDAPDYMNLGDRTVIGALVANNSNETARLRLSLSGGERLSVSALRGADDSVRFNPGAAIGVGDLVLSPATSARVVADVEAAALGLAEIELVADGPLGEFSVGRECVIDIDEPPAEAKIRIRRALFELSEPADGGVNEGGAYDSSRWSRREIGLDDVVAPDTLLLVREQFTLSKPLKGVVWSQRLPANTRTHAATWEGLRQIGVPSALAIQRIARNASWLAAGAAHLHEYVVVADRQGACAFPAPAVIAAEAGEVAVAIEADVERIVIRP